MDNQLSHFKWKQKQLWSAFSLYWLLCAMSPKVLQLMDIPPKSFWHVNTALMLCLVFICLLSDRTAMKTWKRIIAIPVAFLAHALFTIPSAMTLGVLMYSPDHVRTQSEHQAIFFLSSLPVIFFFMWRSRLFVRSL